MLANKVWRNITIRQIRQTLVLSHQNQSPPKIGPARPIF